MTSATEVWVNGRLEPAVPAIDRGLAYGDGVFETLAVLDGEPLDLDLHLARLKRGLDRLGIGNVPLASLRAELCSRAAGHARAALKLIVTRGAGSRGYRVPAAAQPTRIVMLLDWPEYPSHYYEDGISAVVCRLRLGLNPALAGIKHLNRLEQVLARREWNDEHQEGLLMDSEGCVIEGVMSNVFLVRDKTLLTPDLARAGVEGIVREKLLARAPQLGIDVRVQALRMEDVSQAQGAFFCNSLIGLWPVRSLGGIRYPVPPLVRRLVPEFVPGLAAGRNS
jgi:4-amino-4-deoxychorismate lyase